MMKRRLAIGLAAILLVASCSTGSHMAQPGAILAVLATPHTSESTHVIVFPDCGGQVGGFCDQDGMVVVYASVNAPVFGPLKSGNFRVAALDLSVERGKETMHLFVLKAVSDELSRKYRYDYEVVEAYPVVGDSVCTFQALALYRQDASAANGFVYTDAPASSRHYCYSVSELKNGRFP